MSDALTARAEQREISEKNTYAFETSILKRNLDQAQSMLRAAHWEPADVRAKAIEVREVAVQEAREALDRHLAKDRTDTDWLY